jgi:hypothetical protein
MGIIQIVLGGLCSVPVLFVLVLSAAGRTRGPALVALGYAVPAANLLLTGIGSVRIAGWARVATLISAFVWMGLMLMALGGLVLLHGQAQGNGYEQVMAVALAVVGAAFAVVLIVVYTRPSVRATFARRQVP